MSRRTCTLQEAAAVLGVGRSTLYDHLTDAGIRLDKSSDLIRVIRIGQRVLVPVPELERILGGPVDLPVKEAS